MTTLTLPDPGAGDSGAGQLILAAGDRLVPAHGQRHERADAVPDELLRVRIGPLVAAFLLISAIAHAALASPRLHAWYERNLTRGIQPARWVEYSLSSLLMMVVIAMLVGIYDIASLFLIFALNAAMILFGWIMELHNQTTRRTNWNAYWFGCFAAAAAQRLAEICKALEQELVRGPEAWRPPSSRGSRRKTATIGPPSSRAGGGQDGRGAKFAAESEECGHPSRRATTARR